MELRNASRVPTHNVTTDISHTPSPLALSSNNQIPEFFYKQFPVSFLPIGALFNLLIFYYIIVSKKYKSPLFTFIASLAIADFLSCVGFAGWAGFIFPTITAPHPTVACKAVMFVSNMGLTGSVYHLSFFSCLRYYQLCYPLHARAKVTQGFVLKACIGIWSCSALAWAILIISFEVTGALYDEKMVLLWAFSGDIIIRDWCYLVFDIIIPCATILTMHGLKYVQLRHQTKHIAAQHERRNADARAVVIVIILFLIALCPANTYAMLRTNAADMDSYHDKLALTLAYMLAYNSCLDPVVYVIAVKSISRDIQKSFML